jgi:copper resistance protein C
MTRKRIFFSLFWLLAVSGLVAPGLSAVAAPPPPVRAAVRHITLDATLPKTGEAVSGEVTEIRLFFSDAPLLRGASVRIVTASRSLVRSTPPTADTKDPKQVFVKVEPALAPGTYVVQWRCIADDGHVMRGDFRFEVKAV